MFMFMTSDMIFVSRYSYDTWYLCVSLAIAEKEATSSDLTVMEMLTKRLMNQYLMGKESTMGSARMQRIMTGFL